MKTNLMLSMWRIEPGSEPQSKHLLYSNTIPIDYNEAVEMLRLRCAALSMTPFFHA
ncbi:hypothetical protein ACFQ2O_22710 [Pontibacter rugosus]|uniref:Uncharacterized protein n=1 Tax=Pontibacter rugosus TaxID=1745966 RepID=A0ABW3SX08_9BACT